MLERDTRGRAPWSKALFTALVLFNANYSAGHTDLSPNEESRVSVLGRSDRTLVVAVNRAIRDASHKLGNPGCQKVFSDFRDGGGRTLSENLSAKGETEAGYLRWLIFQNGSDSGFCLKSQVALGTNPGDRIVTLCAQFTRTQMNDPGYAAALIIHEELHSLGLGENPPSSSAITHRIVERCGR